MKQTMTTLRNPILTILFGIAILLATCARAEPDFDTFNAQFSQTPCNGAGL